MDPAHYPLALDPQAFAEQVAEVFPQGVCDYSQPGQGVAATETWLQYGDDAAVIFGGEPITTDASLSRQGWASPAFQVSVE